MNPWTDTAQMVARLLFQVHQIPLTLDDVRSALDQKVNLLKNTLELDGDTTEKLRTLIEGCRDTAQLASKIRKSRSEALCSQLLPHLEQIVDHVELCTRHIPKVQHLSEWFW